MIRHSFINKKPVSHINGIKRQPIKHSSSLGLRRRHEYSVNDTESDESEYFQKDPQFYRIKSLQEKVGKKFKGKVDLKFLPKEEKKKPLHISQGDDYPIHFRSHELPYDGEPVDKSRRLIQQRGRYCKLLSINRPHRNNALDLTAINVILQEFRELNVFPGIQAVVLTGAGETAFSEGVDWKEILKNDPADARKLLREDSKLAFFLSTCSLKNVSVMRGYASGSGITMAAFNDFCIATYGARCDWPETSFGMCPSAGNSFILSRLNAKYRGLGTYVALTGTMIRGEDVLSTAIANDFGGDYAAVQIIEAFSQNTIWDSGSFTECIESAIGHNTFEEVSFAENLGAIHRCFHLPSSVEEIFEALETENTEWSKATLQKLKEKSPLALKVTFRQVCKAGDLDLPGCFQMDFRLVNRLMREQDFQQSAAARFGIKNKASATGSMWRFPTVYQVPESLINSMFEPLSLDRDGTCDLILPDEVYLEHPIMNQLKMVKNMGRIKVKELPGVSAQDIQNDYILSPPTNVLPEPLTPLQELQDNLDSRPLERIGNDAWRLIDYHGIKLKPDQLESYVRMMAIELGFEPRFVLRDNWETIWLRIEEYAFKSGIDLKDYIVERDIEGFEKDLRGEMEEPRPDGEEYREEDDGDETNAAQVHAQLRTEDDDLEFDDVENESGRDIEFERSLRDEEERKTGENDPDNRV
eukprot:gb/GECH01013173.1/.p1 GENE.gb/GECH01013173.1/~~gb/GECH01013173.1/.p1  ORF type:complete len:697 (+),score=192.48 gb/GECH01013173.1/:1-2091(+)